MAAQSRPTLLLTRPEPAATRFAAQVRSAFAEPPPLVIAPLMAPVFHSPALPQGWDGTLFTSETGVAGLARLTQARGPAICVGPRTAAAAQAAGWQAQALGGDADGLVAALAAAPPPGLWLHARGREAAGDLAGRLAAQGLQVAEAVVYAQEAQPLSAQARALLAGDAPVLVALFSPRSAALFAVQAQGSQAPLLVAAISASTAQAVEPLAPQRVEVAATPDAPGLLAALARLLAPAGGA